MPDAPRRLPAGRRTEGAATGVVERDTFWRDRAACVGIDVEVFFPVGVLGQAVTQALEAKAICERCPVRETCLRWALETRTDEGVFGGLDPIERRALVRATRRRNPRRR